MSNKSASSSHEFKSGQMSNSVRMVSGIEKQAAKIPSGSYVSLALGSMLLSAGVMLFARRKETANFIGLWAPSLLLLGIYNKFVTSDVEQENKKAA